LLGAVTLARFPITWNQLIEKEALKFKDLVHVGRLFEKVLAERLEQSAIAPISMSPNICERAAFVA
jgi:hypothetical protein